MASNLGTLSIGGLSGIDTDSLVTQLMELEKVQLKTYQSRLEQQQQVKDTWTEVNSKLLSLKTKVESLLDNSLWESATATSSDTSKITATSVSGAAPGTYNFNVTSLGTYAFSKSQANIANHSIDTSLTLDELDDNSDFVIPLAGSGAGSFEIQIKDDSDNIVSEATISYDTSTDTLTNIINKINKSSAGVTAFYDEASGPDGRFILTTNNAGKYYIDIDTTNDTQGVMATLNIYNPANYADADGAGAFIDVGSNSTATLNGITINPTGNQYTVNGTTVTFLQTGSTTVSVSRNTTDIVNAVSDFVTQYNTVIDYIEEVSKFSTSKDESSGLLAGNFLLSNIKSKLSSIVLSSYEWGSDDEYELASQIGITMGAYGTDEQNHLVLDTNKLTDALNDNSQSVENFFGYNSSGSDPASGIKDAGMAYELKNYLYPITKYQGLIYNEKSSIDTLMDNLQDRIDRENERLDRKEESLRKQFSAMEQALQLLNSQSSYFEAQIANLTKK